jgi:hypothetical protein
VDNASEVVELRGHRGEGNRASPPLGSIGSVRSIGSIGSAGSIGSMGSLGSILSIGSIGSVASIGSIGSIASIGSIGSIASIGSIGSIASMGARGAIGSGGEVPTRRQLRRAARMRRRVRGEGLLASYLTIALRLFVAILAARSLGR